MANRLIIVGTGAQAKYALEIATVSEGWTATAVLAIDDNPIDSPRLAALHVGRIDEVDLAARARDFDAAIVCCSDASRKQALAATVKQAGLRWATLVHPAAVVASDAHVGDGAIINPGCIIQPQAQIGDGVMLHAGSIVEHDCQIGDFAMLAPGARLAGWVQVGARCRIFTGASVVPRICIGADATVGAGAVVIRDVPAATTVIGVPAREAR